MPVFKCRDPFALRAEQLGEEGQVLSDWDRFARSEYLRLAVEEEPEDMQVRFMTLLLRLSCCCYIVVTLPLPCMSLGEYLRLAVEEDPEDMQVGVVSLLSYNHVLLHCICLVCCIGGVH